MAKARNIDDVKLQKNDGCLTVSSLTDIYAGVMAYWTLLVENMQLFQQSTEFNTFDDCLNAGLHTYQAEYTKAHSQSISQLEEELRKALNAKIEEVRRKATQTNDEQRGKTSDAKVNYHPIHPGIFKAVKQFYGNEARRELQECVHEKLPGKDRHGKYVGRVWAAMARCILHMDTTDLKEAQKDLLSFGSDIKDASKKKELLNGKFKDEFYDYFEIEDVLQQDESCKFISDLIHPFRREQSSPVKGQLKIVKVMRVEDGNRMYKTLCMARKIAQERLFYTFEILRDYGSFDITALNKDDTETEPLFRVRRKLQPKLCEYRYSVNARNLTEFQFPKGRNNYIMNLVNFRSSNRTGFLLFVPRFQNGEKCKCEHYETTGNQLNCSSELCDGKHKHRKVKRLTFLNLF